MWSANQGRPRNPWCALSRVMTLMAGWPCCCAHGQPILRAEYGILCIESFFKVQSLSLRLVLLD